ncbi:MAG: LptF/LptG family permease [Sphingobacteriales bacterium]
MLKKLDKLILKAFTGPFVATFFVLLFVLVMQFFWKYIDDLVGKGLDFLTVLELTGYVTINTVPLALPLAVLISSIMTFGNLGETYELVAIKSSGIPLLRFMRPLMVVSAIICLFAFFLANYMVPRANLKFYTMLYDIRVAKPAFDIKEGIFYDKLPNYAIKVGKKDKDGTGIYDVIIYENDYKMQDNIITAEKGKMSISPDKKFLEFYLENGWRYVERGPYNSVQTDYMRIGFSSYKKVFDLSSFKVMKTPDSLFKNNWMMLNVFQLSKASDSIKKDIRTTIPERVSREVLNYLGSGTYLDSGWAAGKVSLPANIKSYRDLLPDSALTTTYSRLNEKSSLMKSGLDIIMEDLKKRREVLWANQVEWHKKITLSLACLVLFMIGAPLGSIIRKGGLGMPLVIAVIFFLIFHLLNMFGEKLAKKGGLTPFEGVWLSTFVLVPVGIFLTYKAMHDSQLFNQEYYYRFFRKVKSYLRPSKA